MGEYIRFKSLFKSYDPPEGGVQGLREKLDRHDMKKSFFTPPKIALVTTFVVVVMVAVALTPMLIKPRSNLFLELVNKSENPAFLKYGYLKRSGEAVSIPAKARSRLAVMRVKTLDKNVKFYLIEIID
jgi:hypothetical protein